MKFSSSRSKSTSFKIQKGPQVFLDRNTSFINMDPLQAILDTDPYVSIGRLGAGAYGIVDKVEKRDNPGIVYARKSVRMSGRDSEIFVQAANNEVRILRRLQHRHIVKILEVYTHGRELSIVMLQVADLDLQRYLDHADVATGPQKESLRSLMIRWPGCLIQAIDYLHEMRVKHKDLKPDNILVKGDQVIIADFGISKDLIDEATTKTLNYGPRGTPEYMAPETFEDERRGRSVDIFALGCIFLEIATIVIGPPGSLKRFSDYRGSRGASAYCRNPMKIVQWIWHLWGLWDQYGVLRQKRKIKINKLMEHGAAIYDLAFFMLDPDPKKRITSRQLDAITHASYLYFHHSINALACELCRSGVVVDEPNLPLHSVYKDTDDLIHPKTPEEALSGPDIAEDWEAVKRLWLQEHMWWDVET